MFGKRASDKTPKEGPGGNAGLLGAATMGAPCFECSICVAVLMLVVVAIVGASAWRPVDLHQRSPTSAWEDAVEPKRVSDVWQVYEMRRGSWRCHSRKFHPLGLAPRRTRFTTTRRARIWD